MTSRPLAVFDIDGVLADVRHRLRHVEGPRKQWDAFFAVVVSEKFGMAAEKRVDVTVKLV